MWVGQCGFTPCQKHFITNSNHQQLEIFSFPETCFWMSLGEDDALTRPPWAASCVLAKGNETIKSNNNVPTLADNQLKQRFPGWNGDTVSYQSVAKISESALYNVFTDVRPIRKRTRKNCDIYGNGPSWHRNKPRVAHSNLNFAGQVWCCIRTDTVRLLFLVRESETSPWHQCKF